MSKIEDSSIKKENIIDSDKEKVWESFKNSFPFYYIFYPSIRILDYLRKNNFDLLPDEDLPDLSVLLSLLGNGSYIHLFKKNGINFDKICKELNLDSKELHKFFSIGINSNILSAASKHIVDYSKYLEVFDGSGDAAIYIKKFFEDNHALDFIIAYLNKKSVGQQIDRKKLEIEVTEGKSYLETLSTSQKCDFFSKQKANSLNPDDWKNILTYGDDFLDCSKFISSEFNRLEEESVCNKKIMEIHRLLARTCYIYFSKTGQSQDSIALKTNMVLLFRSLLGKCLLIKNNRSMIDQGMFPILFEKIENAIESLEDELEAYISLHRYATLYRNNFASYFDTIQIEKDYLTNKRNTSSKEQSEYTERELSYVKEDSLDDTFDNFEYTDFFTQVTISRICNAISTRQANLKVLKLIQKVLLPMIQRKTSVINPSKEELIFSNSVMGTINGLLVRKPFYINTNLKLLKHSLFPEEGMEQQSSNPMDSLDSIFIKLMSLSEDPNIPTISFSKDKYEHLSSDDLLPPIMTQTASSNEQDTSYSKKYVSGG